MRMRRHHQHAVALARQIEIVDIAAAAGDEAGVFDPGDRLTDAEFPVHAFPPRSYSTPARSAGRIIYTSDRRG
jgi:hypothetical protein